MAVRGIGVDIVDTVRFGRVTGRPGDTIAQRWFDPAEISQAAGRRVSSPNASR